MTPVGWRRVQAQQKGAAQVPRVEVQQGACNYTSSKGKSKEMEGHCSLGQGVMENTDKAGVHSAVLAPDSPGQVCPQVMSPHAEPGGEQLCPQQWGYVTQFINSVAVLKHDADNENSLNKLHSGHKFPWCNLWLCLHC